MGEPKASGHKGPDISRIPATTKAAVVLRFLKQQRAIGASGLSETDAGLPPSVSAETAKAIILEFASAYRPKDISETRPKASKAGKQETPPVQSRNGRSAELPKKGAPDALPGLEQTHWPEALAETLASEHPAIVAQILRSCSTGFASRLLRAMPASFSQRCVLGMNEMANPAGLADANLAALLKETLSRNNTRPSS